jgi:hypothetical protein
MTPFVDYSKNRQVFLQKTISISPPPATILPDA